MTSPFTDISHLLRDTIRSDLDSKQAGGEQNSPNAPDLTLITSLVQTAYHTRKVTGEQLATDLWRFCTKAQYSIPQAKRFENLMWRKMAMRKNRKKPIASSNVSTSTPSPVVVKESTAAESSATIVTTGAAASTKKYANIAPRISPTKPLPSPSNQIQVKQEPKSKSKALAMKSSKSKPTSIVKESKDKAPSSILPRPENNLAGNSVPIQPQQTYQGFTTVAPFNVGIPSGNEYTTIGSKNITPENYIQTQTYLQNALNNTGQYTFDNFTQDPNALRVDDMASLNGLNQLSFNSNQSWYDPTYANFGSILNRWNNFEDPTFNILNQANIADFITMNDPILRRARLGLDDNLLNQAINPNIQSAAESIQAAQADRIRQLEQQVEMLVASRNAEKYGSTINANNFAGSSNIPYDVKVGNNDKNNVSSSLNRLSKGNNTGNYINLANSNLRYESKANVDPDVTLASQMSGNPNVRQYNIPSNQNIMARNPSSGYGNIMNSEANLNNVANQIAGQINYSPINAQPMFLSNHPSRVNSAQNLKHFMNNAATNQNALFQNSLQSMSGSTNGQISTQPIINPVQDHFAAASNNQSIALNDNSKPKPIMRTPSLPKNESNAGSKTTSNSKPTVTSNTTHKKKESASQPLTSKSTEKRNRSNTHQGAAQNTNMVTPSCTNCGVEKTSLWRRSATGSPLCNACGLFSKLHGKERPISMRTDVIRKRNRGPAGSRAPLRKKIKTPDP